jgi:signal transduction histidine kinase/ligand-binding sensor domain-containing protein
MGPRLSLRNSSIFHSRRSGRPIFPWCSQSLLAALTLVCFANSARALSPHKAISQYIRDEWGAEQGFPGGPVYAIAQTPDGYLWIGTEKGLVRFDGLHFRLFKVSDSPMLPAGPILGLAVDGNGDLWVRLQGPELLRYHEGKFQNMLSELKTPEAEVTAMCAGKDGDILFSGLLNGTMRYSRGKLTTLTSIVELPKLVISLVETSDGKVWLGTKDAGLYYAQDGKVAEVTTGLPDRKINSLLAVGSRDLWIATDNGIVRWNGGEFSAAASSHVLDRTQGLAMIQDRDSNVWIGAPNGLTRIGARAVSSFEQQGNPSTLSSIGPVTALFEDREGNLWMGTRRGFERLRDSVFTTYSAAGGLPAEINGPVYVDGQGRIWFAPAQGGLYWLKENQVGHVANAGLDRDVIYSISGDEKDLWIGRRGGLTQLRYGDNSFSTQTYTQADGLAQNAVFAVHKSRDGTVWAGTLSGGLSRFKNGAFHTYNVANGLGSNSITSMREISDGTMWFGTPNGLNAFANGHWRSYSSREGLPPGTVNCLSEDSSGTLWVGTANGVAFIRSGAIQVPREVPESLHEQVFGIEEDRTGALWIATANHVLRVNREAMLRDALGDADVREFGLADGLGSTQGIRRQQSVVADAIGRIWFSMDHGLSFVDPTPMALSSPPALLQVEAISADGRPINLRPRVNIAAPHQRITLVYSGLSLSVPARVRFKFRLDGFDQGWSEPTESREAVYTNLDSGSYRFRVMASNSDGVWNSTESSLEFKIEPMFWQTWWFRLAVLLVLAMVALVFVRLRFLKLTNQLNLRFEERLAERTRIAQELHDTLLQGFLSASMQLHMANDHLTPDSKAKPLVARVLELMGQVIEEGRNAVRGLRSSKLASLDLEQAFSEIRQEFPVQSQTGFRVIVEGTPRPLRWVIRDEVYLIGHEALSNAFRHAHANEIEVELEFAARYFRVLIRDNGTGIDTHVLNSGRDGHWGLSGMKERAERMGGELRVLSRAVAGTEVELVVPGHIAFENRTDWRPAGWLSRLYRGKRKGEKAQSAREQPYDD